MKPALKPIVIITGIIIAVYLIYLLGNMPGKYDKFAQCLTKKEIVMYGTDWCHYCQTQKKMFGKSFKLIDYKNCDFNKAECDSAGVKGYPTWRFNNSNHEGVQSFDKLAGLTGCNVEM